MFGRFRKAEADVEDEVIDKVMNSLRTYDPEDAEFGDAMGYLERLSNLKAEKLKRKVSPDTMAIVAANLVGILIIVAYEQKHVMTSKATSFLLRTK